jgi:hypothetical protein
MPNLHDGRPGSNYSTEQPPGQIRGDHTGTGVLDSGSTPAAASGTAQ